MVVMLDFVGLDRHRLGLPGRGDVVLVAPRVTCRFGEAGKRVRVAQRNLVGLAQRTARILELVGRDAPVVDTDARLNPFAGMDADLAIRFQIEPGISRRLQPLDDVFGRGRQVISELAVIAAHRTAAVRGQQLVGIVGRRLEVVVIDIGTQHPCPVAIDQIFPKDQDQVLRPAARAGARIEHRAVARAPFVDRKTVRINR